MVQPCHSLVPQQLFADPCSMLENTEQDSKSCCTSSATRPRFDIDTNRRIASAPLRFNLLTRLMNKPPGLARRGAGQGRVHRPDRAGWLRAGWLRAAWRGTAFAEEHGVQHEDLCWRGRAEGGMRCATPPP